MTKYLIKHTTHTTGETFTNVTKIRENESYTVVEAESKEEAERLVEQKQPVFTKEEMHAILNSNKKTPKF